MSILWNADHEWLRMTNAFILCDLVWKVQKSHAANREDSFKLRGVCRGLPCYAASLKNCLAFLKIQPWVSLADVTLLVGVQKCLCNFWFKRVIDCYIRMSQIVETKSGGPSDFCLKREERNLLCKSLRLGCVPDIKYIMIFRWISIAW